MEKPKNKIVIFILNQKTIIKADEGIKFDLNI